MNRVADVMRMHYKDRWSWLALPWIVLSFSFAVNLAIATLIVTDEPITTGGLASIYVFMFVTGMVSLAQTFPFALGMSVRRKDYFTGTAATVLLTSFISAVVLTLLSLLENAFAPGWGAGAGLHFFSVSGLLDGAVPMRFWITFTLLLNMFYLGFLICSVQRRFGGLVLTVLLLGSLIVTSVAATLCTVYGGWDDLFRLLAGWSIFEYGLWALLLALIYAAVSYLLLRRATA